MNGFSIKKTLNNQKGFTLIEIISVLVILGILAAYAIPKYTDLQTQAKAKGMDVAIAEAQARISQTVAKELLTNTAMPIQADLITALDTLGLNFGDFNVLYENGATTSDIKVTVTGKPGTPLDGEVKIKEIAFQ